ncbi:MAG: formylglycine-generating enzyme family protein [Thermoguttaceae bacterium]|jgi:formylglycine-generating enzyme required for sulfatase activity
MFRQASTVALVLLAVLGSLTLATAEESERVGGMKQQITNSVGMKLTLIPPGEFKMGSGESAEATAAFFNGRVTAFIEIEHPQHRVRITKPFYLGTYHVTRGQFRQFVKDTGYKTDAERGDPPGAWGWNPNKKTEAFNDKSSWNNVGFDQTDEHPVVNVSWNDAVAFCKWLSRKEGKTYRLPTEAEWEYACRAGTTTRYYSGDDPETLTKVGNVADATLKARMPGANHTIKASDGYVFTSPVGSFRPNAFGLYDMHGNAWQWCSDYFRARSNYYAASPVDDPIGPDSGSGRVLRGGSWNDGPLYVRSAACNGYSADCCYDFTGFRIAKNTEKQEVRVKDIQDGNIIVLGVLGQPVHQMMTLRGVWKKQPVGKEGIVLLVTHVNNRQLAKPVPYEAQLVYSVDRQDHEVRGSDGDTWEMRGYESCGFLGSPDGYTKELGLAVSQQWYGFASELHVIVTKGTAHSSPERDTTTQGPSAFGPKGTVPFSRASSRKSGQSP